MNSLVGNKSLLFFACALICVAAIWLPFGFALTALVEEWAEIGMQSTAQVGFLVDLSAPGSDVLRPLSHVPFALAYKLDPNSFVWWHVLLLLALLVKSCASSHLIWRATKSSMLAAIAGVLVVVYPADTMQLSFRALHINWSLALALVACALFVKTWDREEREATPGWELLAAAIFLFAILVYEAAFVYFLLPFLIIFAADGLLALMRGCRKRLGLILNWSLAAGLYVAYALVMSQKTTTYEQLLLEGRGMFPVLFDAFPKLFSIGAYRALFGGWFDAVRMTALEYRSYYYLCAAALTVVVLACVWGSRTRRIGVESQQAIAGNARRLALAGLALMLIGYLPYLTSAALYSVSQRSYLFASFGAAATCIALLLALSHVSRYLAAVAATCLLFFGFGAQLVQFRHYVEISEVQRASLKGIVEGFDGDVGNKTLVILDGSNYLGRMWTFLTVNFPSTLAYFYDKPFGRVLICHTPSMEWQEVDALGRKGSCAETEKEWVFTYPKAVSGPGLPVFAVPASVRIDKDKAFVLTLDADGSVEHDGRLDGYRESLHTSDTASARRYRGVLAAAGAGYYRQILRSRNANNDYRLSFGDWWNMDEPIHGSGWREVEWEPGLFHRQSLVWKTDAKASLYFEIHPAPAAYSLHVKFGTFANEQIRQAMRVSLNDSQVVHRWTSADEIEAPVAPGVLLPGQNRIEFDAPVDPAYFGLSAQLRWYALKPTP